MRKPSKVVDSREVERWDVETEVLVVGCGAAGAAAAIEASRAGARVTLLERASGGGGTSAMSGGVLYLGGGTPVQKECGFEDTPEEMYKYLMAACGEKPDEAKIRLYCDGSIEHYHWLAELGVAFKPVFYPGYSGEPPTDDGLVYSGNEAVAPFNRIARPAPRGHVPQIPGAAGGLLMQKLVASVQRTSTEFLTDARCQTLVVTPQREVLGALASIGGAELLIRATHGVILSTGGFINNDEMLDQHAPLLRRCNVRVGAEGDDGSGIRMGVGAGASTVNMGMGSISLPFTEPKELLKGILVNAQGQRFINEDAYMGRLGEYAVFRNDGQAFLILDDETFLRPNVPRDVAAVGETIEELETQLGLPDGSLQTSLALYNRHAEHGGDPLFGKDPKWLTPLVNPPYGALDCRTQSSLYAAFTLGGLSTTVDGEVLTPDGETIRGLYAAGRATACLAAPGYASGLSLGDATFFGRRAGRKAAGV
ncbi:MAG: FAD-dependent oxidoreductase [bacterium]|nr:FAD-dependent oxidoreductase [bacterium]